jgi:hypothetical protein
MERFEPAEHARGQELDTVEPGELFDFVKHKEQLLKERVVHNGLPDAVDLLADSLERYITRHFDMIPEIVGESQDVYHTKQLTVSDDSVTIEYAPMELNVDGDIAEFEKHQIQGRLFGFHRGANNDLRAYVAQSDDTERLMGGIYTKLLSVGVQGSELQFAQFTIQSTLREKTEYIDEQLSQVGENVARAFAEILDVLSSKNMPPARKLHEASSLMAEIAKHKEVSVQFIDALLEIIKYKLRLDLPQDITTTMHRIVIAGPPTNAYKPVSQPTNFSQVTPELGMGGESVARWLGVFFIQQDDTQKDAVAVQIPVQYITSIYRTEQ